MLALGWCRRSRDGRTSTPVTSSTPIWRSSHRIGRSTEIRWRRRSEASFQWRSPSGRSRVATGGGSGGPPGGVTPLKGEAIASGYEPAPLAVGLTPGARPWDDPAALSAYDRALIDRYAA